MSETVEHEFVGCCPECPGCHRRDDSDQRCNRPRNEHRSAPAVESFDMMAYLKDTLAKRGGIAPAVGEAPTPEKPADEDEAAAREWWKEAFGRAYTESTRIAMLARFRTTAREQGRQAGLEEMRQACIARCRNFGKARPLVQVHPSQRLIGRYEGECAAAEGIEDAIRALPRPEPSR